MKKGLLATALLLLILTGCSLFSSEDLHNETEKKALKSFLKAAFAADSDMVEKLARFDKGDQEDFIAKAIEDNLGDISMKACHFKEKGELQYGAICENEDGNDVHMSFNLEEDDEKFYIKNADIDDPVF